MCTCAIVGRTNLEIQFFVNCDGMGSCLSYRFSVRMPGVRLLFSWQTGLLLQLHGFSWFFSPQWMQFAMRETLRTVIDRNTCDTRPAAFAVKQILLRFCVSIRPSLGFHFIRSASPSTLFTSFHFTEDRYAYRILSALASPANCRECC